MTRVVKVTTDDLGIQEALVARSTRTRSMALAAVGVLLLALSGCDGDGSDAGPSPSPSPSSASPSGSATSSPSEEPSSTVAAATGPLLEIEDAVQMNAPAGWKQIDNIVRFKTEARAPEPGSAARLGALSFPGQPPPLDDFAKRAQSSEGADVKRQPDVDIDGDLFFQLAGPVSSSRYTVSMGTVAHGYQVTISFDFSNDYSPEERDQLVAESLATFTWK